MLTLTVSEKVKIRELFERSSEKAISLGPMLSRITSLTGRALLDSIGLEGMLLKSNIASESATRNVVF